MSEGRKEGVGIWWQVYTRGVGFEVKDGANEGWILVGESIVLLTRPRAGLKVVDATDILSPRSFSSLCNWSGHCDGTS